MKTLNVRLLVILFACALVFGGAVYGIHRFQVRRHAYVYLREAERHREEAEKAKQQEDRAKQWEEYSTAAQNYSLYVKLKPNDTDVLEELAFLLAEMTEIAPGPRTWGDALTTLERVLRQDPTRKDVRRKLVDLAMHPRVRRFNDAREHLEDYLLAESPDDGELLVLLARCQAAVREDEAAAASYKRAIENEPDQIDAYRDLAFLLRQRLDRPQEADQWMQKLVEESPDSPRAHFLRGDYLRITGTRDSIDEAMTHAVKALELTENKDRDALRLAAQCALAKEDYDEARRYARRGIELHPDHIAWYITLAGAALREKQPEKAIDALRNGLDKTNKHPDLLWTLADQLINQGGAERIKEARQVIEELRAVEYRKPLADYLLARIEFAQQQWRAAKDGFEKARGGLAAWPHLVKEADFRLAECYEKLGNVDQARRALLRILDIDPFDARALAGLARLNMNTGQVNEALSAYWRLIRGGKVSQGAYVTLARMLIFKNLKQPPAQRNWGQVQQVLDQAEEALPDSTQLPILRAEVLVAQNRLQEAEDTLAAARDKKPDVVEYWGALAALALRKEEWDKAAAVLDEAEKTLGDQIRLRLARARYLMERPGGAGTEDFKKLTENSQQFSREDQLQLLNSLLSVALQMGDDKLGEMLCRRLAAMEPNNLEVRFQLFDIGLRAKNDALMDEMLKEIERVEGKGSHWLYCKALRLSLEGREGRPELFEEALRYVAQARQLQPSWSRLPALAGGIYDRQGNEDSALKSFLEAIELGDRNFVVIRQAARLLTKRREFKRAREVIGLLEGRQTPFSGELDQLKAYLYVREGRYDLAAEDARKFAAQSKNYQDHVWLGEVLSVMGRQVSEQGRTAEAEKLLSEAEASFKRAVELSDTIPETWVALIQFYSYTEQTQKALDAIEQARRKIPADQAPLALAQCFEAMGDLQQAREKYEAALAAAPDDPVIAREIAEFYVRTGNSVPAEAILKRIIDGKVKGEEADVVWARRLLAQVLGTRGNYQSLQKALELVEENLAAATASASDLRLKAILDGLHPARSRRQLAIEELRSLLDGEDSTNPEDRFMLAQLYLSEGVWIKASGQFRSLVASHGDEPRYVAAYVDGLLDHGELPYARMLLKKLEQIAPNQFVTTSLKARLLFKQKQFDEAFELVTAFPEKPDALPADETERLRQVASRLELFAVELKKAGRDELAKKFALEAELMYQKYVRRRPGHELLLAAFLGRQDRVEEALKLVERTWDEGNTFALAQTCAILLRSPASTDEQIGRIEAIVRAATERFEDPIPLLLVVADIHTAQEKHQQAEACYRRILRQNPGHAVAMNNLAVLLALQGQKLEEAFRLINKAIEIAGPVGSMLDSRASVHMALGRPDKALDDLARAINENDSPIRRFHEAQAYFQGKRNSPAKAALDKAHDMGLKPAMLQPIERRAYQKMLAALK